MAERYRFSLPDGRVHESERGIAAIRKAHPDAVITHHIVTDDDGAFVSAKPYSGKQSAPKDEEAETNAAPAVNAAPLEANTPSSGPAKVVNVKTAGTKAE